MFELTKKLLLPYERGLHTALHVFLTTYLRTLICNHKHIVTIGKLRFKDIFMIRRALRIGEHSEN